MNLLEAITRVAKAHRSTRLDTDSEDDMTHINLAHRFLFGKKYSKKDLAVTPETTELVERLNLTGDNFEFIGNGANGTAYGNDKVVFRLESSDRDWKESGSIPIDTIPEGLAAKILHMGECNGVKYKVAERLNTKHVSTLEEIIPFLFKAREAGVVYWDTVADNFGYDLNGDMQVLDHEHFQKLGQPAGNFEQSIKQALEHDYDTPLPLITFDDHNTYVVFNPKNADTEEHRLQHKRLLASLNAVGINSTEIESIEKPPVVRVARTEINYGTPPQTEELGDYIDRVLKVDVRIEAKAKELIEKIGNAAKVDGMTLPSPTELAGMDRKQFLAFYDGVIQRIEEPDVSSGVDVGAIDKLFDAYFRDAYPVEKKATPASRK